MKRYTKAQLNAISRSYTNKRQKEALAELERNGWDFEAYCKQMDYKASPCFFLTNLKKSGIIK